MAYNDAILEGILIEEPVFYYYREKEHLELNIATLEGSYLKDNKIKKIKTRHKIIVSSKFYIEDARKKVIKKQATVLVRGKLSNTFDSDGCLSYCICVMNSNHYLQVINSFFEYKLKEKGVRDFINEI